MTNTETRDDGGKSQALAQFQSIAEMVAALRKADASDDNDLIDAARTTIQEDALSVEVRSDWYLPSQPNDSRKPAEYKILLCTGGPAVQIVGELTEHGEPYTARLEYQDWFKPWTEWRAASPANVEKILLVYASCFYFDNE